MDEWLARFLMVVEAVGLICLTGLAAWWMKLRHDRQMAGNHTEIAELRAELEELRASAQSDLLGLNERLDFAERLLAQARSPRLEKPGTPTPV